MRQTRREMLRSGTAAMTAAAFFQEPKEGFGQSLQAPGAATDPYQDAVLVPGDPPPIAEGAFTIAVLPDTQHYSEKFPDLFRAQTEWITANIDSRNIQCVLHLGDITNRSTEAEWVVAKRAMNLLDGRVPYVMVPGNHDYSEGGGCKDRTTRFSEFFPSSDWKKQSSFAGAYDKEPERVENSFHLFDFGGAPWLVMALEFGPRRDVVRWANGVMARHPNHRAILITHAYMYFDDTRYDWKKYNKSQSWNPHAYGVAAASEGDVMDGEELWEALVAPNPQFRLTLNGHVLEDGLGRLTSMNSAMNPIHQMLVNFQMRPNGGDGWLRLLEFRAEQQLLSVVDFSPTRRECNHSKQNRFELPMA